MASTYSTNLALELIGTGDQAGTWGVTTNTNLGTLLEQAISGYVTQAVSTGTDTTITIPNGSTGVARNMYIELTGTGGTNTNLIVPANKKLYFIFNNASGAVTVKVSGQTGVSVPTGKKMILVSNGTDIVNGVNYIADFGTNSFTVTNLTATSATITNLIATTATVSDLSATVLRAASASITNLALTSLTISSLSITNVSVASATVSSNLTLSAGTANGVLYLNGSKVATSGSALTFNGTNLSVSGNGAFNTGASGGIISGTSTYSGYLSLLGGGSGATLLITPDTVSGANGVVYNTSFVSGGAGPHIFQVGGTEGFRLTSSTLYTASGINVGIGTSSPSTWGTKLVVYNNQLTVTGAGYDGSYADSIFFGGNAEGTTYRNKISNSISSVATNQLMKFSIANGASTWVDSLILNGAGNLGLGVTPSAWAATYKAFQITPRAALSANSSGDTLLTANAYNDGSWKYIATAASAAYVQSAGSHIFYNAASGTINTAISFTQAMTLDASGNLLVGNTTQLLFTNKELNVNAASGSAGFALATGGTARLYMTGSSSDGNITTKGAIPLLFGTNETERARISSGGVILFGTTNDYSLGTQPGYVITKLVSVSPDNTANANNRNWATAANGYENGSYDVTSSSANNTFANDAYRLVVTRAGTCLNTTGTYGTLVSDERLKQDIVDAASQWDDIKAIKFRKYRMRQEVTEQGDEALVRLGVIAQEAKAVSPGLVTTRIANEKDVIANPDLEGKEVYGFKDSVLFWKAAVALQEAMTRIEQLEAKVAALESK